MTRTLRLLALSLLVFSVARADIPPNAWAWMPLLPQLDPLAGILIHNTSGAAIDPTVQFLPQNPSAQAPGDFLILDGTLRISAPGSYKVAMRLPFDAARTFAWLGHLCPPCRKGPGDAILWMRRAQTAHGARWLPAVQRSGARLDRLERLNTPLARFNLANLQGFTEERLKRLDTVLAVGSGGFFSANGQSYAWAVTDKASDFAIGAASVPEPASLALFAAIAVFLLWRFLPRHQIH